MGWRLARADNPHSLHAHLYNIKFYCLVLSGKQLWCAAKNLLQQCILCLYSVLGQQDWMLKQQNRIKFWGATAQTAYNWHAASQWYTAGLQSAICCTNNELQCDCCTQAVYVCWYSKLKILPFLTSQRFADTISTAMLTAIVVPCKTAVTTAHVTVTVTEAMSVRQ